MCSGIGIVVLLALQIMFFIRYIKYKQCSHSAHNKTLAKLKKQERSNKQRRINVAVVFVCSLQKNSLFLHVWLTLNITCLHNTVKHSHIFSHSVLLPQVSLHEPQTKPLFRVSFPFFFFESSSY